MRYLRTGLGSCAVALLCFGALLIATAAYSADAPKMIVPSSFDVSATGAFTYHVPIDVPPGTGGMKPDISLDYSSQNTSDGLVGWGWTISGLPAVSRCPQTLAQDGVHGGVNYDANDKFCFEGQRLVPIDQGGSSPLCTSGTEYRTEVEGWSRIASCGSYGSGPAYFLVWTKSGQIMELGNSNDSQILTVGLSTPQVRVWAVDKIVDTAHNYMTYAYTTDGANGQAYPKEIDYTMHAGQITTAHARVVFHFSTKPTWYQVPSYQAGALVKTTMYLDHIYTYAWDSTAGALKQVFDYQLAYTYSTTDPTTTATTQPSMNFAPFLLRQVALCDTSSNCSALPATTFQWQEANLGAVVEKRNSLAQGYTIAKPNVFSADFNADGYSDPVVLFGTGQSCPTAPPTPQSVNFGKNPRTTFYPSDMQQSYTNAEGDNCDGLTTFYAVGTELLDWNGDGFTDVLEQWRSATNEWSLLVNNKAGTILSKIRFDFGDSDITRILTGDFNGDGLSDFYGQHLQQAMLSNGDDTYNTADHTEISSSTDTKLLAADFDGDGCTDILANGSQSKIFYMCSPAQPASIGNWLSNYDITLADFNGDGKTDVLLTPHSGGQGQLWLSTGTGLYEQNPSVQLGTSASWGDWGKYSVITGDWNGDGKADIAIIPKVANGTTGWHIYYSTGTGGFVDSGVGNMLQGGSNTITAVAADWSNDGGPDIWLQGSGTWQDRMELFPFIPLAMIGANNGIGGNTWSGYAPLTDSAVYTKGSGAAFPTQDVATPLWVVGSVFSSNGIIGRDEPGDCVGADAHECIVSTYHYTAGKMDAHGRGFLGFQTVAITNQPGIVQTTNYCTQFPCTGLVTSETKVCPVSSITCATAVTLKTTTNTYQDIVLGTGTDGVVRHYNQMTRTAVTSQDTDGSYFPSVATNYSNFDAYENAQTIQMDTRPPGGGDIDVVRTATNTYNNDVTTDGGYYSQWYIGRIATSSVRMWADGSARGSTTATSTTRQSQWSYDPTTGLLAEEVVEPEDADTSNLKVTTDYGYDPFGNKSTVTITGSGNPAPAPRTTTTTFDSTTYNGAFPTKVQNALTQYETWDYDIRFGTPISHIGPNRTIAATQWVYTNFGNLQTETHSDGTVSTYSYTYCNGVHGGTDTTCPAQNDSSGCEGPGAYLVTVTTKTSDGLRQTAPTTRTYYDVLSRIVAKDVQGFDGTSWSRTCTAYGWYGGVQYTTRPYFNGMAYGAFTRYDRDPVGRPVLITYPDQSKTAYTYNGQKTTVINDAEGTNETTITTKNDLGLIGTVEDANSKTTSYTYNAEGNVVTVTDPYNNLTQNTYDVRGRLKTSSDPDRGAWSYTYDSLSQMAQATDANGNTTSFSYDQLGRMTNKTAPDMVSTWQYDTATDGIGQLAVETCDAGATGNVCRDAPGAGGAYTRTFTFDTLGRPATQTDAWGSNSYSTAMSFDGYTGFLTTKQSFSGFTTRNIYNSTGYLCQIVDSASTNTDCSGTNLVYWQANSRDAEFHLTSQGSDNGTGLLISNSYYPNTGRAYTVCAAPTGASCTDTNLAYTWDNLGNLSERTDDVAGLTEHFCYDSLNRLLNYATGVGLTCPTTTGVTMAYDDLGNITKKTDVGTYHYPQSGGVTTSHQLSSIDTTTNCAVNPPCYVNGTTNPSFSYDLNGNMTGGANRTIQNTVSNLTSTITQGPTTWTYKYDPDGNRASQTFGTSVTGYFNDAKAGIMAELRGPVGVGPVSLWHDYIMVDGGIVAERTVPANGGAATLHYFVRDNLGSTVAVTDKTGAIIANGQLSYDAWGKQRNANWTPDTTCSLPASSPTTRAFAGQEEIANLCPLVNMNARMYDSQIGRFLSADPLIGSIYDSQALNRYSYVGNDPLSLTDTTGLCFLGCFWHSPAFSAVASIAVAVTGQEWALPVLETQLGLQVTAAVSTINAGISGGLSGYVGSGKLQGAELGAGEALAFAGVHFIKSDFGISTDTLQGAAESAGLHGLVGGVFSVASRGTFASGFLAAGTGDLAGDGDMDQANGIDLIKHSVAGGLGTVLGGGKFANGAVTGAFGYLYNSALQVAMEDTSEEDTKEEDILRERLQDSASVPLPTAISPSASIEADIAENGKQFFVAGYELLATTRVEGDDYVVNVGIIEAVTPEGITALRDGLISQAEAAGASRLVIQGTAIVNAGFNGPSAAAIASRLQFTFQRLDEDSIRLTTPTQPLLPR